MRALVNDASRKEENTITYLEILSDFTNETLEGELPDKEFRRLLVSSDLTESDSSGPETMGLLDTTSGRLGHLASLLGGELFTGGLATGGFTSGLLEARHETRR